MKLVSFVCSRRRGHATLSSDVGVPWSRARQCLQRSRIDLGYLSRRVDRTFLAGLDRLSQKADPEKAMNGSTLRDAPRADKAFRIGIADVSYSITLRRLSIEAVAKAVKLSATA